MNIASFVFRTASDRLYSNDFPIRAEKLLLLSVSTDHVYNHVLILIVGGTSLGSGENEILTPRASLKSETSHTDTDSANSLYPVLDDTYSAAGELESRRHLNVCVAWPECLHLALPVVLTASLI